MSLTRWMLTSCVPGLLLWSACGSDEEHVQDRPDAGGGQQDGGARPDAATPDAATPDAADDREDAGDASDAAADDAGTSDDAAADGGDGGTHPPAWYESDEPLALSITGTLGDAFAAAFAGTPDGIIPPLRKKDPFAGVAAYEGLSGGASTHDVTLAVRGNSSLQECDFPKLKLTFEQRVDDAHDVFFGTKKLKIGTHCGEEEEVNGTIGRFRNEKAAWREELVYRLARALDITIMNTRLATIAYADTSAEKAFQGTLTRKAFLLEHVDELARRLGAMALPDPVDCGEDPAARPDGRDVLRVKFFHAMIGNWDWALGSAETSGCGSLMNTEVLVHPDGMLTLVPADFDLAAVVVGEIRNPETNQAEPINAQNAAAWVEVALAEALSGESSQAVDAIAAEYAAHEADLRAIIAAAPIDTEGKTAASRMLDGFFVALEARPRTR